MGEAGASQVTRALRNLTLDAFSDLVHTIYDAGLHPQRWMDAVRKIVDSMGATKGLLFTPTLAPQHGGLIFPYGIGESSLQTWGTRYIDKDIWHQAAQRKKLTFEGSVYTDGELVPSATFVASPFYREFLTTMDIRRVCGGVVFEQAPGGLPETVLSVFRGEDAEPFGAEEKEWLRRLVPHVSRSLGLMQRLEMHRVQKASTLAALDRLPFGVALLNQDRRVIHLNKSAERVMARNDGLTVNARGMLEGQGAKRDAGTLQAWLARFADRAETDPAHFSDGFALARYMLHCAPVASEGSWDVQNGEVRFVVFITDPAALTLPAAERLMELYGLTRAQAAIALEFARGHSYKQAARRMRVSQETVRSHVKALYPRLRVHRQADLVRLILSLAQVRI
jgi:DNA-binding CsgD family transcriptional regulator